MQDVYRPAARYTDRTSPDMNLWPNSFWGTIGFVAFMVYFVVPLITFCFFRMRLHLLPEELPINELPDRVQDGLASASHLLNRMGFSPIGCYRITQRWCVIYTIIHAKEDSGQAAGVSTVISNTSLRPGHWQIYFSTKVDRGIELLTTNWRHSGIFATVPQYRKIRVRTDDIALLYQVHLHAERDLINPDDVRWLPQTGELADEVLAEMKAECESQAQAGYMKWKPGDVYQPTWLGALMMTWALLPPLRQWRRIQQLNESRQFVKKASQETLTAPTGVPITHERQHRHGFEVIR